MKNYQDAFAQALQVGRPPNVVELFPNSRALIVSGKFIDRAMLKKGKAIAMAANGRNYFVIRGALMAAQRANAAIIIEIAKSESNYCGVNFWNIARIVDNLCNEMGITVPVAVHADHYGIKGPEDVEAARTEIPSVFDAGMTSIALDASHLPDEENLLSSLQLWPYVPKWAGHETEVGEIKGKTGLSTPEEALFLIQGLNAHDVFPDWIALNNGTTHGIEAASEGIQIELTARIHDALAPYKVSGAQHGTSGNSSDRLRKIAGQTRTTKANVATALQMISWGLEVNDYGNAKLDDNGNFVKVENQGVTEDMWKEMTAYAESKGLKKGDFKKINLPFESRLLAQPRKVRLRMAERVEQFVYNMLVNVLNCKDTAPIAVEEILAAGSHDPGPKAQRLEDPENWSESRIRDRGAAIERDRGEAGNFED
ncbi:fructose/tagatose bisphosphate aldolase [Desulfosalsimonas propionicica]|uniref:Fructose/tagatose bisphosphate aldolase n=1 Tax=Desulfosalsimonas propionicica TaxID=332175 RepID=A0A7W0HJC4_9BACT|nr:class II fructose-bisphosphate aldolase [Desulfosalsimonas propionicica]MBA2880054.1 fructose/tagatose bisphosphate aldolase [Desulfosalsimonas propionicica]